MAGGLAEPDVPGDDRGVDLTGEVSLHLFRHLDGQVGAAVVHGQQHPFDGDAGVELLLHDADGGQQVAQSLQGVILALNRDQHRVRRTQAV